ncbi:RraA family protein [Actinopolymorpha rutila]|uniref:Putative 4-hydroxy-4-methyl-2-oxoglutarate aldolase n=1 Tax=Actinopolymorpha rutila TaxID=446787 RepID=A0A852ZFE0_9ACTN|nr:RraA family protein [Actinopolymorpha rutila]NYH88379.1 regulator of RNase E activity RraA [Actinopolymorpha rutila]
MTTGKTAASAATSPSEVAGLYKYLRVTDVADAMDGIGYFDIGLVSRDVRPLWRGMKFWGEAATLRCVPANRPMWKLDSTEDIVAAHGIWFEEVGRPAGLGDLPPGHVIVTDGGGAREVGFWGSMNAMAAHANGAVGIVTDGYCRDTAEIELQRTPVCAAARGRTIIPGRIEAIEAQVTIGCGGVQVRPGDIVGTDDDGVIVVPAEIAGEVAVHARAVLIADMHARRRVYEKLGRKPDETVDIEAVEAYYAGK